jgi:hypothetical protein
MAPEGKVMLSFQRVILPVACAGLLATAAQAQVLVIPAGSTPDGDYLRGVGIAAMGMGTYNLYTAQATSINVDTAIRWNEYLAAVFENENRNKSIHREAVIAKRKEDYNAILRRIRENPEEHDLMSGDALNAILDQLNDPKVYPNSYKAIPVTLSVELVRRIPFRLNAAGIEFSMQRLSTKGKGKWPVALRQERFAPERLAYERAVETALGQQVEGKMSVEAVQAVEGRVADLIRKFDQEVAVAKDALYRESKSRLRELQASAQVLKNSWIEQAIGELDRYSGTNVNDLRLYMQKYKLRFSGAATPEERKIFPEIYAALIQQKELLGGAERPEK